MARISSYKADPPSEVTTSPDFLGKVLLFLNQSEIAGAKTGLFL